MHIHPPSLPRPVIIVGHFSSHRGQSPIQPHDLLLHILDKHVLFAQLCVHTLKEMRNEAKSWCKFENNRKSTPKGLTPYQQERFLSRRERSHARLVTLVHRRSSLATLLFAFLLAPGPCRHQQAIFRTSSLNCNHKAHADHLNTTYSCSSASSFFLASSISAFFLRRISFCCFTCSLFRSERLTALCSMRKKRKMPQTRSTATLKSKTGVTDKYLHKI